MACRILGPPPVTHDPSQVSRCEWRERFDTLIRERMSRPFAWGAHDCCLFAADAVQAVASVDLASDVRGTYCDARGAAEALQRIGGIEAAGARVGVECPPLCARVGDIGLVHDGDRSALAVCVGAHWLVPAAAGLAAHDLNAARKAWRTHA